MRDRAGPPLAEAALLIALVFGLLLAAGVIGGPRPRVVVVQLLAAGAPVLVYAVVHPRDGFELLGLGRPRLVAIAGSLIAGSGILLISLVGLVPLSLWIFGRPPRAPASPEGPVIWQLVALAAVPAICEELVVRGVLLRSLLRYSAALAVLASALVFASFHFSIVRMLPTFGVGVVCGLALIRAGDTWAAITCHFANNALLVLLFAVGADLAVLPRPVWIGVGGFLVAGGLWLIPNDVP